MNQKDWRGIFPAITTPFKQDLTVDYDGLQKHVSRLIDTGCRGIVALGSLGEGATLTLNEKLSIIHAAKEALDDRAPIVAGIASSSTEDGVKLAQAAAKAGCDGLMILPPYVYQGDWRETKAHLTNLIAATDLSCIVYNNPIAYGTDILPSHIQELSNAHGNLHAVKESSGDIRRVAAIRELVGDKLAVLAGLDDAILESIPVGAVGWVAGLVNALPEESVRLFELANAGRFREAQELYEWFLPLLRLDTLPKFVQYIKLVQQEVGRGNAFVRPPRLELEGEELRDILTVIKRQLELRPIVEGSNAMPV